MCTRLWALAFVAGFIAACGGGGEGGPPPTSPPPPPPRAQLDLTSIFYNGSGVLFAFNGDTYAVGPTVPEVFISGSINVQVPVHWTNSAGGSGDDTPQGVGCSPPPGSICQALSWFIDVPLHDGTNNIVITATGSGGSNSVSLTVIRQ